MKLAHTLNAMHMFSKFTVFSDHIIMMWIQCDIHHLD